MTIEQEKEYYSRLYSTITILDAKIEDLEAGIEHWKSNAANERVRADDAVRKEKKLLEILTGCVSVMDKVRSLLLKDYSSAPDTGELLEAEVLPLWVELCNAAAAIHTEMADEAMFERQALLKEKVDADH